MTDRFIVKHLTHCPTIVGDEIGKETSYMITLHVIFYLDNNTSQLWGALYHLKVIFCAYQYKNINRKNPYGLLFTTGVLAWTRDIFMP